MDLPGHPKPLVGRHLPVLVTAPPAHGHQGALPGDEGTPVPTLPVFSHSSFPGLCLRRRQVGYKGSAAI